MIITFTPNPSLDRTAPLAHDVRQGRVNRLGGVSTTAAGKGVNLSTAVHLAGHPTRAIIPLDADDPLAEALRARGVPAHPVPVGHHARTNLTISHPDGTTTKINEPGEMMTHENVTALVSALLSTLPGASWLALCGSLPPGAPTDWYVRLAQTAREVGVKVAVDASGPALEAVVAAAPHLAPDVMSPNAYELQRATGIDVAAGLADDDLGPAVEGSLFLVARGVARVLTTLGAHGAVLATPEGVWHAVAEPVRVVSPISSGDSALAGFLLALVAGADSEQALQRAVAYGTACVLKPASQVPYPREADEITVHVERLA